jgi:hypothetical protein
VFAEDELERARDARLVVDDEDAALPRVPGHQCQPSVCAGRVTRIVVPRPARLSTAI